MNARNHSSFPVFELAIVAALVLIGWAAYRLYKIVPEVEESRREPAELRDEFYEVGDFVQTNITELNEALGNYLQGKNPQDLKRFEAGSRRWDNWMNEKRRVWLDEERQIWSEMEAQPTTTNRAERIQNELLPLVVNIEPPYTNFQKAARFLIKNTGKPLIKDATAAQEQIVQSTKALLLGFAWQAHMQGHDLELVLGSSQNKLSSLQSRIQSLRFGLLLAGVALGLLLVTVVYHRKWAQAQAVIREHFDQRLQQETRLDKLAHFGQLAQELAHEIKQPLTAINARAYTLQKTLPPGSETHKDAAVIRSEINRLNRIVKDFLELARPAEPALVPLAANETLGELQDLMASQLAQDSVEFKLECEENVRFLADPQQLKQVLINLVKNAAECLDHNGTVTVRAKRGRRQLNAEPTDVAIIEVEDNGPGIPPEIKEKIFDPFFSTKGDGTGLGLAIAARIIDKHGGRLEFDTELGKGSVFRIALPACRNGQPA